MTFPPSNGQQSGGQVQAATGFEDPMTKAIAHDMVHKRPQCEKRVILNLRKLFYRRCCVAAVERNPRDLLLTNHKGAWAS
jgi:hypothetical protein